MNTVLKTGVIAVLLSGTGSAFSADCKSIAPSIGTMDGSPSDYQRIGPGIALTPEDGKRGETSISVYYSLEAFADYTHSSPWVLRAHADYEVGRWGNITLEISKSKFGGDLFDDVTRTKDQVIFDSDDHFDGGRRVMNYSDFIESLDYEAYSYVLKAHISTEHPDEVALWALRLCVQQPYFSG